MESETTASVTPPVGPGTPPVETGGPTNPFARLAGVLFSPGETFAGIARKPDWLVPLLVWIVIAIGATWVLTPRLDYEPMYRSMLERNSALTETQKEQQLDKMLEQADKGKTWGKFAPVATVPLMTLVVGVLFWGALRAFGAESSFRQTFAVTVYAFAPQFVKSIITTAIAAGRTSIDARAVNTLLKSNVGAFVTSPTESPVMFALLGSIDLFTIWTIVLFSIGLAAVSKFSPARVAILVISFYLVVVLFKVGFAVLLGGFS